MYDLDKLDEELGMESEIDIISEEDHDMIFDICINESKSILDILNMEGINMDALQVKAWAIIDRIILFLRRILKRAKMRVHMQKGNAVESLDALISTLSDQKSKYGELVVNVKFNKIMKKAPALLESSLSYVIAQNENIKMISENGDINKAKIMDSDSVADIMRRVDMLTSKLKSAESVEVTGAEIIDTLISSLTPDLVGSIKKLYGLDMAESISSAIKKLEELKKTKDIDIAKLNEVLKGVKDFSDVFNQIDASITVFISSALTCANTLKKAGDKK